MDGNIELSTDLTAWSGLSLDEIAVELSAIRQPKYRAEQIYRGIHKHSVLEWQEATDLPAGLRSELDARRPLRSLSVLVEKTSRLDGSVKIVASTRDGGRVESVLMRGGIKTKPRLTVCVSSQIGCPAACAFCASGLGGFTRNLTTAEITDQIALLARGHLTGDGRIDNVVFMGMGEPFMNYRRVMESIARLRDARGLGIGSRRITVSTVGIVPGIAKFADEPGEVNLAVSLHAPTDALRTEIVPYNRRYPIADILQATKQYMSRTGRRVSFEYVLLAGRNDFDSCARDTARLLKPLKPLVHMNLIPWNPFPEAGFSRGTRERAEHFAEIVRHGGVNATVRYSKGLDIDAACGQLRRTTEAQAMAS